MVTFRKNNNHSRRGRFRTSDRNFKRNGDSSKFKSDFSTNSNFQRKSPGRNNHNASKLIEKYNDLAREALAHEDKILSENYFQHADHFTRVLSEQEKNQSSKTINNFDKNLSKVISDENKKNNSDTNEKLEGKVISS
tara:strand:- start:34 stop:444 length:411 start_codon:yes stop_codon:yes gene_type:complete